MMMTRERAAEKACDWVWEGFYDKVIRERIMQGEFDEAVRKRAEALKVEQTELRDLSSFIWSHPEYDDMKIRR